MPSVDRLDVAPSRPQNDSMTDERRSAGLIEGINVTPLVDVALVLLVVFLMTAQLVTSRAVSLDLPRGSKDAGAAQTTLAIAIDPHGAMTVDGRSIPVRDDLVRAARAARTRDVGVKAVIDAAPGTSHGVVIAAIDDLRAAGIERIAFARAR